MTAQKSSKNGVNLNLNEEKSEITIQSLMEPLEDIAARAENIELSGLLVVPVSAVIKQKIIPKKSERNIKFCELIEKVLDIDKSQVNILNFSINYLIV